MASAQINLIIGDYFKAYKEGLKYTDQAAELITWLHSKTYVLALLRDTQIQATGHAKAVLRAVLACWTAHYLAYRQLLKI